jgi:hypothetical protein
MAMSLPHPENDSSVIIHRALAAGRIGTWHWDIASDAVLWDGALGVIYGLAPGEAPTTAPDFLGLVIPEDRDQTVRTVSHGLEGAATIEHRFRASVGDRVFWIHDRAHVVRDRDARPTSVIGMCCDVAAPPAARITTWPGPLGEHRPVDIAAYLGTIVESLRRNPETGETREIDLEAASARCTFDCAVKVALILLELVAPVGAAADRAAGRRVKAALQTAGRSARLRIADNGIGRPTGPAIDLGLRTAAALAEQLGGALGSEAGTGRVWTLEFPLPEAAR